MIGPGTLAPALELIGASAQWLPSETGAIEAPRQGSGALDVEFDNTEISVWRLSQALEADGPTHDVMDQILARAVRDSSDGTRATRLHARWDTLGERIIIGTGTAWQIRTRSADARALVEAVVRGIGAEITAERGAEIEIAATQRQAARVRHILSMMDARERSPALIGVVLDTWWWPTGPGDRARLARWWAQARMDALVESRRGSARAMILGEGTARLLHASWPWRATPATGGRWALPAGLTVRGDPGACANTGRITRWRIAASLGDDAEGRGAVELRWQSGTGAEPGPELKAWVQPGQWWVMQNPDEGGGSVAWSRIRILEAQH